MAKGRGFDRVKRIIEHSEDIIFLADLNGRFTFVNSYAEQIIGCTRKEIEGKFFTYFVLESKKEEVEKHYRDFFRSDAKSTYLEFPVQTKAGNQLWVGQTVSCIYDEQDLRIGFFAIARPITKLRYIEQSLTNSEKKLQSVIDSALDAVIIINQNGIITEWNDQSENIFGWKREEAIGVRLSNTIIPPKYREAHEHGMKHFLKTGEGPVLNNRIEIEAINKEGKEFPVELTIIPNSIDDEYFFSAFVRDISEIKQSQRILAAINDLAVAILGKTSIEEIAWEITRNTIEELGFEDCVVYITDLDKKVLIQKAAYGNKSPDKKSIVNEIILSFGEGIVGASAESKKPIIVGNTKSDVRYIEDDSNRLSEIAVPIISEGEVIGVIDSEHPDENFYTNKHLEILTTIANMVSAQLRTAISQDQKSRALQALKDSEERWQKLVSDQPEGIQITIDGVIKFLNPAGLAIYGASNLDDVIGTNLIELSDKSMLPVFKERLKMLKNEQRIPSIEFDIKALDGKNKSIEVSSNKVIFDGKEAIQTIVRDISEKKEQERRREILLNKLEAANKNLNEFAHVVSHDLKAPLRAISSLSEWILEDYFDKLDETGKEQLNLLVENVSKMDQLIDGILTYSVSTNDESLTEQINTKEEINKVLKLLKIPESVDVIINNEMPVITFNKFQFRQIIQNLISNSLKFIDNKTGMIKVSCKKDKDSYIFSIHDNGIGIEQNKEDIFRLFTTFAKEETKSTGIGLSIVKKILDNKGERIWYESKKGKGTTFFFTITETE